MKTILYCLIFLFTKHAFSVEYLCTAYKKSDAKMIYSQSLLEKYKFSTKLIENDDKTVVSRCSFSTIDNKVTCDDYNVDRIQFDKRSKVKKYYVFESQFDFQIFNNMKSIENNGRGSIQYGTCIIVSP